jgi:hypothetical protein
MQLILYPILFVLPFKFVEYIIKGVKNIKKTSDIWNKPIKESLALKLNPT